MNVTQLKQKLAVLEAQGYGELFITMMFYDHVLGEHIPVYADELEVHENGKEIKLY